jgi:rubrerythrin
VFETRNVMEDVLLSSADDNYINNIAVNYRKNKISYDEAESQIKERFGRNAKHSISVCNTPAKGSFCPVCKKTGLNSKLGNEKNPGYHCRICGYSARTWQPPITRRLKKHIKIVVLDES